MTALTADPVTIENFDILAWLVVRFTDSDSLDSLYGVKKQSKILIYRNVFFKS